MTTTLKGLVQGNTVLLDEPVPLLDGKRVIVVLEPVEERPALAREEGTEAWRLWIASSPGGPVRDKS
jgi:hypothetical protein